MQEKLDPQTICNWNFMRSHAFHTQDEFAELLNDKCLQLQFSKHFVIFQ